MQIGNKIVIIVIESAGASRLKAPTKLKQHSVHIKNYPAHPHDMVHVPAKL